MVSVVARMNQSSFKVEYDVGRPTIRRLGAFRPLVGAVFGTVIYLALQSHLMHIDTGSADQQFPFFAVWAFIAGFSERFVRDTLDGVEAFGRRVGARRGASAAADPQPLAARRSTRASPTRRVSPSASKRSSRSWALRRPLPVRSRKRASVIEPAAAHSSSRSRFASS